MPRPPSKRVKCDKCGKKFSHYGLPRHRAACNGSGRLEHKGEPLAKVRLKAKRKYTKRAKPDVSSIDTERKLIELEVRTELAAKLLMGAI